MDYEKLKELISARGLKQGFIAAGIGVSNTRMHNLLNGGRWRLDEVTAFCKFLRLTKQQRDQIFFASM